MSTPLPPRGRGTATNLHNRFAPTVSVAEDDGWYQEVPPTQGTEVRIETAKTIITRNASPAKPLETFPMTTILHIYTRVSSTAQQEEGTSLENQRNLGFRKATELGYEPRLWNEGGQSSFYDDLNNRPVLVSLLIFQILSSAIAAHRAYMASSSVVTLFCTTDD